MLNLNRATIIGYVGNDPKLTTFDDNKFVTSFNVATTDFWTDNSGTKKQITEWHRIVVFGPLAQYLYERIKKGKPVFIEGVIKHRTWINDENIESKLTEIVINNYNKGIVNILETAQSINSNDVPFSNEDSTKYPESYYSMSDTPDI